jgi:hypothetical protein
MTFVRKINLINKKSPFLEGRMGGLELVIPDRGYE